MRFIKLTQGYYATVDDDMFSILNEFKWYAVRGPRTWYAGTNAGSGRKRTRLKMDRFILMCAGNVDHIDRNGLCNLRDNLRLSTLSQNHGNQAKTTSKTTSRFKGVSWKLFRSGRGKWVALIGGGKRHIKIRIGTFDDEIEAAKAYDKAAIDHFGEFARINFPRCR